MSFYTGAIKVLGPVIRLLLGVRGVQGIENIPEDGGLICANHTSLCDPIILAATLKKPIKFMGKAELFKVPVLSSIIKAFGAFPVKRGGADAASLRLAQKLLENGEYVGIFPQGTRCPKVDPRSTDVKMGVGLIAGRSHCRVIPVYIKTPKNKAGFFKKTYVIIGKPIENEDFSFNEETMKEYENAAKLIFDAVCSLESTSSEEK